MRTHIRSLRLTLAFILGASLGCHDLGQDIGTPTHVLVTFKSGFENDSIDIFLDGKYLFSGRAVGDGMLGLMGLNLILAPGPHVLTLALPDIHTRGDLVLYVRREPLMRIDVHYVRHEYRFSYNE